MAVVPTSFATSGYEYNYNKDAFPYSQSSVYGHASLYTEPQGAINWQTYPSQIAPVNSAMNSLFPPFSRGSTQKVIFFKNFEKLLQNFGIEIFFIFMFLALRLISNSFEHDCIPKTYFFQGDKKF